MAGILEGLASGLRVAGGTLSPEVYQGFERQTEQGNAQNAALRNLMLQQMMKGVESGAVTLPEGSPLKQIVGPDAATQERQRALADRRKISEGISQLAPEDRTNPLKLAEVFMVNGDHATGAKYIDAFENRQARIQTARDALEGRLLQLQQMSQDKALDRASREQIAQQMDETRRQSQALMSQIAAGNQELKRISILQQGENQRINQDLKQNQQTNTQIGQFANHLQQYKIPGLVASVQSANDLLKKYEGGDIPGMGLISGSEKVPNVLRTQEANDVRSAIQGATNDLLNMYSGLAVTLPESERRDLEQMRGGNYTVEDFKNAWPRVVKRLNTVVGNMKASVPPKALEEYQARPGAMNMNPITPAFDKELPKVSNDADFNKLPSGAEFIAPDGSKRKKP